MKIKLLEVSLKKGEKLFLGNKFYVIKKGSVLLKKILENGKVISYENILKKDEIIGNFLALSERNFLILPEIEIEIEALEETLIEEIKISKNELNNNPIFKRLLNQLIKQYIIKFISHICDPVKVLLILLKINSDSNGVVEKKNVSYENLNMSRTQYYSILTLVKKENLLKEEKKRIILNLKKIDEKLNSDNFLEKCI
ncbi:MAG: hypothetical protein RR523_08210 [Cetobacterium sp.]|uniref:hypothetical protein n=1 Tax=Cetobacterium sp. TaxID=2071632 RepID=UPI002FCC398E